MRYASPVAHARHVLRLTPVSRDGQRVQVAALQIVPEPAHRREGQDFFGNRLTWIEVEEPHDTLTVKLAARVAVDAPSSAGAVSTTPPGKRSAMKHLRPATSARCRRRIFCFRAAWCRSIRRSAITCVKAFRPAGRFSMPRSN
jgi:transglutaminase-like putative cysteine protease